MFLFPFITKYFLVTLLISSLIHWLFRSVLFIFLQIFEFSKFPLMLITNSSESGEHTLNHFNLFKCIDFISFCMYHYHCPYFFKDFIYLFLDRGEGREIKRERNINVWLPLMHPPTGDLACNPGMCPGWELNQRPFGSKAGTQSAEPHQPGPYFICQ